VKTIHKYKVVIEDNITIQMPEGARVLCVQEQRGDAYIWVAVDDSRPYVSRHFCVMGTGEEVKDVGSLMYIGTFQLHAGAFVGHLFEKRV
jgi:hypothetical protein